MAGINSILNIASTSLVAQQVALSVTGENITNVNTPGYSRQRAIMTTAPTSTSGGYTLGNGVLVTSVQRYYDATLQKNITDGNSSLQYNQSMLSSLQQIEASFNELTTDGLGKSIQDFLGSWQTLAANAGGTAERQTVLSTAQVMVDNFNQANDSLRNVQANANSSLTDLTTDITLKSKNIASLNAQIIQADLMGASSSELRDQRDYLAQELAKDVGATFTEEKDGSLTVSLSGGQTLVERNQYATVYTSAMPLTPANANNVNPSNHILITEVGDPPLAAKPTADTDISATIGGQGNSQGKIGAMIALRDSVVPGYLQKLDELAYNLADQVNTLHNQGWNLNNTLGGNFFNVTGKPNTISNINTTGLSVGDAVSGTGIPAGTTIARIDSANQITLAPPLLNSLGLGTYTFPTGAQAGVATGIEGYSSSDPSVGISLRITSTNGIAAADTIPSTGGSGNNAIAKSLAAVASQKVRFSTDGGASSSVISYYNALVSGIGVDVQGTQNASAQGESYVAQLTNLRESNSGVSLDEELTNMLKYQKAYQAAAKMITTATEMMDVVLGMVR